MEDMDSQHSNPEEENRLPTPATPAQPESHQRAPTLIAGEMPGSYGKVKVWSPNKWRLWAPVGFFSIYFLLGVADAWFTKQLSGPLMDALVFVGIYALNVRRPVYLTTDNEGIGITRWLKGSAVALRWSDIDSVKVWNMGWFGYSLVIKSVGQKYPISINLANYPKEERNAVLHTIMERATLCPASTSKRLFVRDTFAIVAQDNPVLPCSGSAAPPLNSRHDAARTDEPHSL